MSVVRLRFSKQGKVRFTSHRDVARIFERALRRADVPIAYTEGFSPRPKLSFGLALSTGHESEGEYLDLHLRPDAEIDPDEIPARLDPVLPEGIDVQAIREIDRSEDSLQAAVTSCTWHIEVTGESAGTLADAVERALAASALPITRTRKGKEITDDVRPAIIAVDVVGPRQLVAELATQPRACRPAELLRALDEGLAEARVIRTHQWIQDGTDRREPLELAPVLAGHAQERAS